MPPRMMFRRKHRPKGLEFGACKPCNNGSSRADLVAAMMGRIYPDAKSAAESEEFERIYKAVRNNVPGLLNEMHIPRGGQKLAIRKLPSDFAGGVLRVGGPLVTAHMQAFALKLGLALHHQAVGRAVPTEGGVMARWFSNYEVETGDFPTSIFDHLTPLTTLKQGTFEVSDQFQYSSAVAEDRSFGMYYAVFPMAFAVVAFAAIDRAKFEVPESAASIFPRQEPRVYSPEEVGRVLAGTFHDCSAGALL
jgi:hypothetical protein